MTTVILLISFHAKCPSKSSFKILNVAIFKVNFFLQLIDKFQRIATNNGKRALKQLVSVAPALDNKNKPDREISVGRNVFFLTTKSPPTPLRRAN